MSRYAHPKVLLRSSGVGGGSLTFVLLAPAIAATVFPERLLGCDFSDTDSFHLLIMRASLRSWSALARDPVRTAMWKRQSRPKTFEITWRVDEVEGRRKALGCFHVVLIDSA